MPLTLDGLVKISELIRNTIITFGAVAAGGWAIYEYSALARSEREAAALEKDIRDIELKELTINRPPTINIEIQVMQSTAKIEGYRVLGTVTIANVGNRRAEILLKPDIPSIRLTRLEVREHQIVQRDRMSYTPSDYEGPLGKLDVFVGRQIDLPFFFEVSRPGVYLVSFETAAKVLDEELPETYWQQLAIVEVTDKIDR